jgi:hypothetical protein
MTNSLSNNYNVNYDVYGNSLNNNNTNSMLHSFNPYNYNSTNSNSKKDSNMNAIDYYGLKPTATIKH